MISITLGNFTVLLFIHHDCVRTDLGYCGQLELVFFMIIWYLQYSFVLFCSFLRFTHSPVDGHLGSFFSLKYLQV